MIVSAVRARHASANDRTEARSSVDTSFTLSPSVSGASSPSSSSSSSSSSSTSVQLSTPPAEPDTRDEMATPNDSQQSSLASGRAPFKAAKKEREEESKARKSGLAARAKVRKPAVLRHDGQNKKGTRTENQKGKPGKEKEVSVRKSPLRRKPPIPKRRRGRRKRNKGSLPRSGSRGNGKRSPFEWPLLPTRKSPKRKGGSSRRSKGSNRTPPRNGSGRGRGMPSSGKHTQSAPELEQPTVPRLSLKKAGVVPLPNLNVRHDTFKLYTSSVAPRVQRGGQARPNKLAPDMGSADLVKLALPALKEKMSTKKEASLRMQLRAVKTLFAEKDAPGKKSMTNIAKFLRGITKSRLPRVSRLAQLSQPLERWKRTPRATRKKKPERQPQPQKHIPSISAALFTRLSHRGPLVPKDTATSSPSATSNGATRSRRRRNDQPLRSLVQDHPMQKALRRAVIRTYPRDHVGGPRNSRQVEVEHLPSDSVVVRIPLTRTRGSGGSTKEIADRIVHAATNAKRTGKHSTPPSPSPNAPSRKSSGRKKTSRGHSRSPPSSDKPPKSGATPAHGGVMKVTVSARHGGDDQARRKERTRKESHPRVQRAKHKTDAARDNADKPSQTRESSDPGHRDRQSGRGHGKHGKHHAGDDKRRRGSDNSGKQGHTGKHVVPHKHKHGTDDLDERSIGQDQSDESNSEVDSDSDGATVGDDDSQSKAVQHDCDVVGPAAQSKEEPAVDPVAAAAAWEAEMARVDEHYALLFHSLDQPTGHANRVHILWDALALKELDPQKVNSPSFWSSLAEEIITVSAPDSSLIAQLRAVRRLSELCMHIPDSRAPNFWRSLYASGCLGALCTLIRRTSHNMLQQALHHYSQEEPQHARLYGIPTLQLPFVASQYAEQEELLGQHLLCHCFMILGILPLALGEMWTSSQTSSQANGSMVNLAQQLLTVVAPITPVLLRVAASDAPIPVYSASARCTALWSLSCVSSRLVDSATPLLPASLQELHSSASAMWGHADVGVGHQDTGDAAVVVDAHGAAHHVHHHSLVDDHPHMHTGAAHEDAGDSTGPPPAQSSHSGRPSHVSAMPPILEELDWDRMSRRSSGTSTVSMSAASGMSMVELPEDKEVPFSPAKHHDNAADTYDSLVSDYKRRDSTSSHHDLSSSHHGDSDDVAHRARGLGRHRKARSHVQSFRIDLSLLSDPDSVPNLLKVFRDNHDKELVEYALETLEHLCYRPHAHFPLLMNRVTEVLLPFLEDYSGDVEILNLASRSVEMLCMGVVQGTFFTDYSDVLLPSRASGNHSLSLQAPKSSEFRVLSVTHEMTQALCEQLLALIKSTQAPIDVGPVAVWALNTLIHAAGQDVGRWMLSHDTVGVLAGVLEQFIHNATQKDATDTPDAARSDAGTDVVDSEEAEDEESKANEDAPRAQDSGAPPHSGAPPLPIVDVMAAERVVAVLHVLSSFLELHGAGHVSASDVDPSSGKPPREDSKTAQPVGAHAALARSNVLASLGFLVGSNDLRIRAGALRLLAHLATSLALHQLILDSGVTEFLPHCLLEPESLECRLNGAVLTSLLAHNSNIELVTELFRAELVGALVVVGYDNDEDAEVQRGALFALEDLTAMNVKFPDLDWTAHIGYAIEQLHPEALQTPPKHPDAECETLYQRIAAAVTAPKEVENPPPASDASAQS